MKPLIVFVKCHCALYGCGAHAVQQLERDLGNTEVKRTKIFSVCWDC